MLTNLISVYLLLLISGFGYAYHLTSWHKQRLSLSIALAPIISATLITISGVFILTHSIAPKIHFYTVFYLISVVSLLLVLFADIRSNLPKKMNWKSPLFFIAMVLWIGFILNNYSNGILFNYLNPDVAGYLHCSSWLAQGHSLQQISGITVTEMFALALRWGTPVLVGEISLVSQLSVYQTLFPIILTIFASGAWAIALIYRQYLDSEQHPATVLLIALAILLNGSFLYFYYEGFCPNIVGVVLLNIILALLLIKTDHKRHAIQLFILVILCTASLITFYNELYVVGLVAILGFSFLSLIKREQKDFKWSLLILLAAVIGFLCIFPLSFKIIHYTITNTGNMSNVGYQQPAFIAPSDIVGLTNIYSNSARFILPKGGVYFCHRSLFGAFVVLMLSLWVLYEFRRWIKNTFVQTLIIGVLGLFLVDIYFILFRQYAPYNYIYDKLAMDIAPGLIAFFFIGLAQQYRSKIGKIKLAIALLCIFVSAFLLLSDRLHYRGSVNIQSILQIKKAFNLNNRVFLYNERGYRQGKEIGELRYVDRASDHIIMYTLNDRLFDQWEPADMDRFSENTKVLLLVHKADLLHPANVYKKYKQRIIFDTRGYFVITTGKTLYQLKQGNALDNLQKLYVLE